MENLRTFLVKLTGFFTWKYCVLFYNEKTYGLFFWGEEGEEKRPPVGKDINRPKIPNHSPPRRYDDHASFRVTRCTRGVHSRVVTSFFALVLEFVDLTQFPRVLRGVHAGSSSTRGFLNQELDLSY